MKMMEAKVYSYPLVMNETFLDLYGHVNNGVYFSLFEEARWDLINQNGYGLERIKTLGLGPIVLEVTMRFIKELRARDKIVITSQTISYEKKIGKLEQKMIRGEEICSTAIFTIALFNMKERKLVPPTEEWLMALGINSSQIAK